MPDQSSVPSQSPLEPNQAQREALEALRRTREQGRTSALVVMAPGLGKTHLAAWDARRSADGGHILYLAHQREILDQACETFRDVFGRDVPISTLHGDNGYDPNARIVFSTIQTMFRRFSQWRRDYFDYVVIDESHHVVAPTYRAVVSHFEPRFKLGITATPRRMDEQDILPTFEMNKAYDLPIEKAIVRGYLASIDYKVFSDIVVGNLEQESENALSLLSLSRQLFQDRSLDEVVQIYDTEFERVGNPRALIFCPSVRFANELHRQRDDIEVVTATTPARQRNSLISQFRSGSINALAAVNLFNEGINIPDANLLVFLRSTASETIFLQQLGRGLRKAPGKEAVHVLDFVAYLERLLYLRKFRDQIEYYRRDFDRLPPLQRASVSPSRIEFDDTAGRLLAELETQRFSPVDLEILSESMGVDDLAEELSAKPFHLIPLIRHDILKPDLRLPVFPGVRYSYFLRDRLGEIKRTYRVWEERSELMPHGVPELEGEGATTFLEELKSLEYPPDLKQFYAEGKEYAKKLKIE